MRGNQSSKLSLIQTIPRPLKIHISHISLNIRTKSQSKLLVGGQTTILNHIIQFKLDHFRPLQDQGKTPINQPMKLEHKLQEFDEKISHRFRGEGWDLNPSDSSWCCFIVEDMNNSFPGGYYCNMEDICHTKDISGSKLFMGWISFTDPRKTDRLILLMVRKSCTS